MTTTLLLALLSLVVLGVVLILLVLLRLLAMLSERIGVLEGEPAKDAPEATQVHFSFHQDW